MRNRSLLGKIMISAGSGVLVFVGIWTAAAILWLYAGAVLGLEKEADRQARELSTALAPLVWNLDNASIQSLVDTKAENEEFLSIVVLDPSGGHTWSPSVDQGRLKGNTAPTTSRTANITQFGQSIGSLNLKMTLAPRQKAVVESIITLVTSLLLLFLAILLAVSLAWRGVASRLTAMVQTMEGFSSRGGTTRMDGGQRDELGILATGFNTMADRIQANTRSMEREIQERTDRLIESEKLALVGSLVAGVAHEINTPIGNGITITSWLATRTKEIVEARKQGIIADEDWDLYLSDVDSTLTILQSGLDRTSNLIQSFKKIGADQVVDERRTIDMNDFLGEISGSLFPTLKRFPHQLALDCPEPFLIESHPGTLFQIVTNLILNAHLHAFKADQPGTIVLGARPADKDQFLVTVKDDGAGMTPEVRNRIFEPFFTTHRLEGGTGLGLSIVHNLVQHLGGTIDVVSAPGQGSEFLVTMPRRAPDRN